MQGGEVVSTAEKLGFANKSRPVKDDGILVFIEPRIIVTRIAAYGRLVFAFMRPLMADWRLSQRLM
jgi:hypothetical protein